MGAAESLEQVVVPKMVDDAIIKGKNYPYKKSVELVLGVCEDILCRPLDEISAADKDILLGVLGRYTIMKRQIEAQEKAEMAKAKNKSRMKDSRPELSM